MNHIGADEVWSLFFITVGLSVVMIALVVLSMWWVFAVFKDKKNKTESDNKKGESRQDE